MSVSRSSISNFLRLLKLPVLIQTALRDKKISMGHARALLSFDTEENQVNAFQKILEQKLNVREAESMKSKTSSSPSKSKSLLSKQHLTFQNFFSDKLSSKVIINKTNNGNGKLSIQFNSDQDLNRIIEILKR